MKLLNWKKSLVVFICFLISNPVFSQVITTGPLSTAQPVESIFAEPYMMPVEVPIYGDYVEPAVEFKQKYKKYFPTTFDEILVEAKPLAEFIPKEEYQQEWYPSVLQLPPIVYNPSRAISQH